MKMSNENQAKVNATLIIFCFTAFVSAIVLSVDASILKHILVLIIILSASARFTLNVWSK